MSALSIQPTFPIFTDIDGQPLDSGYVFIGTANLNPIGNPINVFFDAALTQPAVQPIRTISGYPSNAGTPARLYVNSDYSIQVQNKNGTLVYSAPTATEQYSDVVISAVNAVDVIYDPAGTGAVQQTAQGVFRRSINVAEYGAVGDGVTDDRTSIQNAINAAAAIGGGMVQFESGKTYAVGSTTRPFLSLPSNVGLDLNFCTLQRIGTNFIDPFIENANLGGMTFNHIVRNGTIRGTGAPGQVSDQGSAILMFNATNVLIENINTENTNGDGLQFRLSFATTIRDCEIGDYGRNGISPTSGEFVYSNLVISGNPIAGANPGLAFDSENDSAIETAVHYIYGLKCSDVTFVDFFNAPGGDFAHEIYFVSGDIGPVNSPRALLIQATNNLNGRKIFIGPDVNINADQNGIEIKNVNDVNIVGCKIVKNPSSPAPVTRGIAIFLSVSRLKLIGVKFGASLDFSIEASQATAFNDSFIQGCDLGAVYLVGSNNIFGSSKITALTIFGATSTGNVFNIGTQLDSAITLLGGALESDQVINKTNYDILLNGHLPNVTSNGRIIKFSGRDLSATTIGLGRIQFIPPSFPNTGAEIVGRQNGGNDNGEIQVFVSNSGNPRFEAARWDSIGNYHPGSDNAYELGTASFRWEEVFAVAPAINTSDQREKQQFSDVPEEWIDAWSDVKWQRFKWNHAVEKKGDENARWHVGLVAQQIKEVFEAKGIDPFQIGLLCYDEWDEVLVPVFAKRKVWDEELQKEIDEEYDTGERVVELQAGNRYGVRYAECSAIEAAWVRRKLETLS